MHARLDISQRLAVTLGPGQIVAYFQPKFGLDMQLKGVEALARWHGHDGRILAPGSFLPACADLGLKEELTLEMITQACEFVGGGRGHRGAPASVSINLSSSCVTSTRVFDHLRQMARRHGLSHEQIVVEILEDALEQPTDIFLFALERYRRAGFRLSIDDFGTGAAGLRRLIEFHAHEVKVARCFIDGVSKDSRKMALVQSVIALAQQLNMDAVIEGVEDLDDLAWCRGLGGQRIILQGFALARPMPSSRFPLSVAMAA